MSNNNAIRTIEEVTAVLEEQELSKEELMTYLRQVMEIRAFEDNIANLLSKALLKGASHLYAGQEAVAVGAVAALRDDDLVTSTHRGHGHAHAHGDKAASSPEAKQEHFNKMMAEVLGKSGGYCKGKGGSMHIADVSHGNLGATGIRRRQYTSGCWRCVSPEADGNRPGGIMLLRRRRIQHRQLPRVAQHGLPVGPAHSFHG
jgi:TPP-dependent pyruvate/acetoin dehydrogenase alpha subunit